MVVILRLVTGFSIVLGMSVVAECLVLNECDDHLSHAKENPKNNVTFPQSSSVVLLARGDVRAELVIDDRQRESIDELFLAYRQDLCVTVDHFSWQTNFNKCMETVKACQSYALSRFEDRLPEILTDQQMARLMELQLQREGRSAFCRADIVAALELTNDQLREIERLPLQGFLLCASHDDRAIAYAAVLDLLTERQKSRCANLLGETFSFNTSVDDHRLLSAGSIALSAAVMPLDSSSE